ncbi:MAG TPA: helix-turn-helix domain-containing protein [Candidatus Dormibacteraeota bacterium]|nr:helix-turn-helix domain-containing protein [Candidatus Dormibacteraeota bacterium]
MSKKNAPVVPEVASHKKPRRKPVEIPQLLSLVRSNFLTPEQIAQELQVPTATVYELTRKRKRKDGRPPMPALKCGKFLRFRLPDVEKWMETNVA